MPFKDSLAGTTHFFNDGCGESVHNDFISRAIKEFEEEFCKSYQNGDIRFLRSVSIESAEEIRGFLHSQLESAYKQGLKDAEGTKGGMERYLLGFEDGKKSFRDEIKKWAEKNKKKSIREFGDEDYKDGWNQALQDLLDYLDEK